MAQNTIKLFWIDDLSLELRFRQLFSRGECTIEMLKQYLNTIIVIIIMIVEINLRSQRWIIGQWNKSKIMDKHSQGEWSCHCWMTTRANQMKIYSQYSLLFRTADHHHCYGIAKQHCTTSGHKSTTRRQHPKPAAQTVSIYSVRWANLSTESCVSYFPGG